MSDVQALAQRIDDLVSHCWHRADEDTRTVISNLTGIYAMLSDVVAAQARELHHWAQAAQDAEEARDEARGRASDMEAENSVLAMEILDANAESSRLKAENEGFRSQLRGGVA